MDVRLSLPFLRWALGVFSTYLSRTHTIQDPWLIRTNRIEQRKMEVLQMDTPHRLDFIHVRNLRSDRGGICIRKDRCRWMVGFANSSSSPVLEYVTDKV